MLAADLLDPRPRVIEAVASAVDLDEEDATGVEGIARVHGRFDSLGRELIHHLDRARHDAGGDDRGDRLRRLVHRRERSHERPLVLGKPRELDGDLGHEAERSL